ncbi:hypothetical protein GHT06_011592 [Daphnia sinensis]|uniref:Uncharacterized protein n=1 Tax=Daphnia sinensis TaxID=1820382 RepID=A0AAD5PVE1_9CRUS|nr:hypothetical protein GHT06_011592 [Daphnia sinensis]
MGSGISLCCRSNRTSFIDSPRSKSCKPNSLNTIDAGAGSIRDQPNEDGEIIDDFEKELQQLNDETLRAEDMSPPPTLDDSMSDNDTSVPKIAAIVTSKARESPRDAISTSISRTNSNGAMEIRNSPENAVEAIDAFANETFQEDALDLNDKDALPEDTVTEVINEGQPEVAQPDPEEHVEEPETMINPTEETAADDPHMSADSDGIEETELLEPQEIVVNEEATEHEFQENIEDGKPQENDENELETDRTETDLLQEKAEEDEQASAEMVDVVDSAQLQIEEEMAVNEELLNSSPLEDTEEQEIIADGAENSEVVANHIEESENAETEPTNLLEHIDTPDAADLTDADGLEETVQLESSDIVEEGETDGKELQENIDEDNPQEIEVNESEADGIDKDQPNENAEENEQTPADIVDVVDPPMAQEEGETADNDEVLNSLILEDGSEERETEAENVENQETLTNQLDESDNAADTSTDLLEHINNEQQQESSHVPEMNIRLPRSADFIDEEEDFPVETDENNPLDIDDVGSSSVANLEDELSVAQGHYEEIKQIENSDLDEQIQEENVAIEIGENVEGNDNYTEETENEKLDEPEVFAISDLVDEEPSQLENIEEVLPEVESEDVSNETPGDNDLHQDASFAEEQSLLSPINENSPFEVENAEENVFQASDDNVLADEDVDQHNILERDDALTSAENVIDTESTTKEELEAEPNETNDISCADAQEHDNLQSELGNEQLTPDLKENGFPEEEFNELLSEVDKEVSNDDEEEIWSKLQKDLQLEEEEQRNLAAIKIQSTFRGYKTRKEFNEMSQNKNETENEIDIVNDIVENVPEEQPLIQEEESLENNDDGKELTGALAGVTESIATIALIMTDTPQHNPPLFSTGENDKDDETDGNIGSENVMDMIDEFLSNEREVNDVTEEPMSNGEEIRDVQLIESYVITSSVADNSTSPESQEAPINLENNQENELVSVKDIDDGANETGNPENEAVDSDPGVVFELYVESNETTNDGLLESYCPQREHPSREKHLKCIKDSETENPEIDSDAAESLDKVTLRNTNGSTQQNQLDLGLLERENLAATKIQAGYRGHQDRKRVKDLKHHMAENVSSTGTDVDKREELENAAATKIQAGFRGHQDRKRIRNAKCHAAETGGTTQTNFNIVDEERHQFNYDECSQQVQPDSRFMEQQNAAATKIQAGYRGHQDRKRIKELKATTVEHNVSDETKGCYLEKNLLSGDEEYFEEMGTSPSAMDLQNAAATKIQAGFRGHQDRKRVKHLQHRNAEKDIIDNDSLQCMYTDDVLEQSNDDEQSNKNLCLKEKENAAATTIQAGFRGHQARKRVKNLQHSPIGNDGIENGGSQFIDIIYEPDESSVEQSHQNLCLKELENDAATKIQAGFRGYRDRKKTKHLKKPAKTKDLINNRETHFVDEDCLSDGDEFIQNSENPLEKENMAATKIQAGFRGHQDRKRVKCIKENIAATKIQAGFRGHQDRKRVKHLKESINKSEIIQSDSLFNYDDDEEASVLDYDQTAEAIQFELKNNAATKIQAGFRGHQDRKRVKNLQRRITENDVFENDRAESMDGVSDPDQLNAEQNHQNQCTNELENAAATKIQAGFRGYQDRKNIKHLKREATSNGLMNKKEAYLDKENIAATKIQAGFRGYQDRKQVKRLKDSTIKNETTDSDGVSYTEENSILDNDQSVENIQVKLENDAATKIQAGFRGHQDRKRVKNLQCHLIENEDVDDGRAEGVSDPDLPNVEQSHENICVTELENAAATKIQAGFRGYQDRKNVKNLKKEATTNDLVNETNLIEDDIDVQDSERNLLDKKNSAATKIQAGFRGHQDRKRVKHLKDSVTRSETIDSDFCNEEALLLDDDQSAEAMQTKEQNAAATKIQAGFRGHQDRKRVRNLKISTDIAE